MIADERRRTLVFTAYLTFWKRNFSPVFLVAELFTLAIDNTSGWAAERLLQGEMSTYGRGIAENAILSSFGFSLPFLNNNVQPCPCCASLCLSDIWYRLSLFFFFPSADILDHLSSTSSQPAPRYIVKIKKNLLLLFRLGRIWNARCCFPLSLLLRLGWHEERETLNIRWENPSDRRLLLPSAGRVNCLKQI